MSNDYIPRPAETSDISLPEELRPLIEPMALNVHEAWARKRLDEGWTYGAVRDDARKQTPCLVPFDELPEIEKEYDRATSQETLKLIMKLGFVISKK